MKTLKMYAFLGTVIAALIFSDCSKDDDLDQSFYNSSSKQSSENLTGDELEGLLYMAEKQKLQRDVYLGMYERALNPIFNELYQTDGNNFEMVSETIEFYGQKNPVLNKAVGEFKRQEIQAIYDEFKSTAFNDVIDMLDFSIKMEESTALEIRSYMTIVKGNADLSQMYTELLACSYEQIAVLDNELNWNRFDTALLPAEREH